MYRRGVIIDSTGENVSLTETVDGVNMKAPVTMSLKEYVDARQRYELHKIFADEARRPQALLQKNDLGELLGNITKISIPVPPNPLFSIFGKNEINLTIGGAVDIKAGFSNIKSDQTTLSSVDQPSNTKTSSRSSTPGTTTRSCRAWRRATYRCRGRP
jgi:cell surface protein SprA